jgi:hypothetical protein
VSTTNEEWQNDRDAPFCLFYCTGPERTIVSLYWDCNDHSWHCIICGCRLYKQVITEAEIIAERVWDMIWDDLEKERSQIIHKNIYLK